MIDIETVQVLHFSTKVERWLCVDAARSRRLAVCGRRRGAFYG
jgi:hypothetical protein